VAASAVAGEPTSTGIAPSDLLRASVGEDGDRGGWHLGLYPGVSGVLGAPNIAAGQGSAYLSIGDGRSFSLFLGIGRELGSRADADLYTVGWGGVRRLPGAVPQRGFHGKFLRYRRWQDDDHGPHDGLSVGTETGVGPLGLAFEVGAARSDRNHWLLTAQIGIKLAVPVFVPLEKKG
jgi:hypothetical protein